MPEINRILIPIGFRPKHSTLSTLIQICDDFPNNMDQGKINCVVFLEIKIAFDSINNEILLIT